MSRDIRVSFKLSENVHTQFKEMAEEYGVTMSSLTSLIVGQWVYQQNKVVSPVLETLSKVLAEQVQEVMQKGEEHILQDSKKAITDITPIELTDKH